jgi:hypothetical protein
MAERLGIKKLSERVLNEISDLVGCPAEGVTGVRRNDTGWVLTIEVRELEKVPETGDVLASYEVHVDDDGEITEFERKQRYLRGRADS